MLFFHNVCLYVYCYDVLIGHNKKVRVYYNNHDACKMLSDCLSVRNYK